jgi:hypothetical protein
MKHWSEQNRAHGIMAEGKDNQLHLVPEWCEVADACRSKEAGGRREFIHESPTRYSIAICTKEGTKGKRLHFP